MRHFLIIFLLTLIGYLLFEQIHSSPVEISAIHGKDVSVPVFSPKPLQNVSGELTGTFKRVVPVSIPVSGDADKMFIYQHESGNTPTSINHSSGACGLGQALPCSKLPCSLNDYACQDNWFTQYAISRYGSWKQAREFWQQNRWWWYTATVDIVLLAI